MKKSTTTPIPLLVLKRKQDNIKIPNFQRNFVWKKHHKELLIDTILKNYYIPEVIFGTAEEKEYEYIIIDGQQRITTIFDFMNDKIRIKDNTTINGIDVSGLTYSKLPENIKLDVDAYTLNYVVLQGNDEEMREMFLRLQNTVPLVKVEARNAISYKIRETIHQILKHNFFAITCQVNIKSNKRMKYNEIVEQLLLLELYGIIDIKDYNIKKMYDDYGQLGIPNDTYKEIINILDYMYDAFEDNYAKSYFRKVNIHGLYLVIKDFLAKDITHEYAKDFGIWFITFENLRKEEKNLPPEKQSTIIKEYIHHINSGTGNKESLLNRKSILTSSWETLLKQKK